MTYTKLFDPDQAPQTVPAPDAYLGGDKRDGSVYVFTDPIVLAVNVALATRRPLLLHGPSGSGKSSLAKRVARIRNWRYYEEVVTSRTQARDMLWTFDTLRRLNDAQTRDENVKPAAEYIRPGVFWWAFHPATARWRGANPDAPGITPCEDPGLETIVDKADPPRGAVVLIDEIDKADPDVPNNLLVPIGSFQFDVHEAGAGGLTVKASEKPDETPLIIITTNNERELPNAFLRRCVILRLLPHDAQRLVQIAQAHLGDAHVDLYQKVASLLVGDGDAASTDAPSTAEYLDTLETCLRLQVKPEPGSETWEAIRRVTAHKDRPVLQGVS